LRIEEKWWILGRLLKKRQRAGNFDIIELTGTCPAGSPPTGPVLTGWAGSFTNGIGLHRLNAGGKIKKNEEKMVMEIEKFLEMTKKWDSKKKGKKEELEKFQKFFERFHLLNRAYLDKESFEKAQQSISSMAEAVASTVQYLDGEITRLRNKRMKLPLENVELGEMQKIQSRNELVIKEFLAGDQESK
jgi:hypothetical protein